ncbi:sulfate transporter family-domain-containing protein [Tribonema minus]|uniref:Sulfate transporter family-domain-containing protein n=1 Tax=Tribonema minus TaxID=303371 RepID=A0A836CLR3_9STRA|nr:sulfate transporter family-domain-containing protein [Tribonema minus]
MVAGGRTRVDSWNDDAGDTASNGGLRTEADLLNKFQGPGFNSSHYTFGEALKRDWRTAMSYVSSNFHLWGKQAGQVKSVKDAAIIATKPFPIVKTLANYKLSYISFDAAAGLVEGIMKIPSGLAYALLANMPPQYGLYTSLMPPFIYMLLGSCAQISFGVTAIEALVLGEYVKSVLGEDVVSSEEDADINITVKYTLYLSFMVGIWQLIFRIFQLQFVSVLLADPVMSGFSTGGAFIIATSQLGSLLGIKLSNQDFLPGTWVKAIQQADDWNWVTIALGLSSLAVLMFCQYLNKRYMPKFPVPWQIFIVIIGIVVTSQLNLKEDHDVSVIGDIPSGFPIAELPYGTVIGDIPSGFPTAEFPSLPVVPDHTEGQLFAKSILPAFVLALFVFVMTLSLGTFFSGKNGYKVNASQELLTIGVSNTVSSMCGAFICSASFSRTAVVHTLGAKTVLHGVMALLIMILAVTLITEQLYYLPKCILAIIVINAIGSMLEFRHGARYYKTSKWDFAVWLVTFIVCLLAGAQYGIYAGVGLALLIMLFRSASSKIVVLGSIYAGVGLALLIMLVRSASSKIVVLGREVGIYVSIDLTLLIMLFRSASFKIMVLGRLPGTTVYRNVERFPMAKETEGVKIVRLDGSLNFANWEKIVHTLQGLATKDIHSIAFDASAITTIDSSSLRGLLELVDDFETKGVKLLLANWKAPQRDLLERSHFYEHVTDDTIFLTLHDAVIYAKTRVVSPKPSSDEKNDPATITEAGGHVWRVGYTDSTADAKGEPAAPSNF